MNGPPILKPRPQLPRFQQVVWVMRLSELRLLNGEGLIHEDAPSFQGLPYRGYQGTMQIAEEDDSTVELLWQRIDRLAFEVNLPKLDIYSLFGRQLPGPVQGFSGFVTTDHGQLLRRQEYPVMSISAGHVQDGSRKPLLCKQVQVFQQELCWSQA